MLRVRIITVDHYMGSPIPDLDVKYSDFRGSVVKHVPVIRIFGTTPTGEKTCVHVHGVFPYICIPYDGSEPFLKLSYQLAASLDKAINIASGYSTSNTQHVYKVVLVSGLPFYGYHNKKHQFLKIFFYKPSSVKQAVNLLQNGAVLNKIFQPHEAHVPFILQFFIDFNLYGMSFLDLHHVRFRRTNFPDLMSAISQDLFLPDSVPAVSLSHYEVDVSARHILNRPLSQGNGQISNPGLAAIWEDENRRRAMCKDTPAAIAQLHSQRSAPEKTRSELFYLRRLHEILDSPSLSGEDSSLSGEQEVRSNKSYAIEEPPNSTAMNASFVSLHVPDPLNHVNLEVPPESACFEDTIVDEDLALLNLSSSQRLSQSLNKSLALDFEDLELLDVLETLVDTRPATVDTDSVLGSQTVRSKFSHPPSDFAHEEPDSSEGEDEHWLDKTLVPEEDETRKLLDLTMPDIDERVILNNYLNASEPQPGPSRLPSVKDITIPQVDGTNNLSSELVADFQRKQLRIPQVDGLNDLPLKPVRKSLGMRGGGGGRGVSRPLTRDARGEEEWSVTDLNEAKYSARTGDLIFNHKKETPASEPSQMLNIPAFQSDNYHSKDEQELKSVCASGTLDDLSSSSGTPVSSTEYNEFVRVKTDSVPSNGSGDIQLNLNDPEIIEHAAGLSTESSSPNFMMGYFQSDIVLQDDEVRNLQPPVACCSSTAGCVDDCAQDFGECADAYVDLVAKKLSEPVLRGDPCLYPEPSLDKEESFTDLMESEAGESSNTVNQDILPDNLPSTSEDQPPVYRKMLLRSNRLSNQSVDAQPETMEEIDNVSQDLTVPIDFGDLDGFSPCSCTDVFPLSMINDFLVGSPSNESNYADSEMCRLSGALENGQMEEILQSGGEGNVTTPGATRREELLQAISSQKGKLDCLGSCSKARMKSQMQQTSCEDPVTDELLHRGIKPKAGMPRLGLGKNMELAKLYCGSPSPPKRVQTLPKGKTDKQLKLVKRESRRLKLSITAQLKKNQGFTSSAKVSNPSNSRKSSLRRCASMALPDCYVFAGPKLSKNNIDHVCLRNNVTVHPDVFATKFHQRSLVSIVSPSKSNTKNSSWLKLDCNLLNQPSTVPALSIKQDMCEWSSPKYKILHCGRTVRKSGRKRNSSVVISSCMKESESSRKTVLCEGEAENTPKSTQQKTPSVKVPKVCEVKTKRGKSSGRRKSESQPFSSERCTTIGSLGSGTKESELDNISSSTKNVQEALTVKIGKKIIRTKPMANTVSQGMTYVCEDAHSTTESCGTGDKSERISDMANAEENGMKKTDGEEPAIKTIIRSETNSSKCFQSKILKSQDELSSVEISGTSEQTEGFVEEAQGVIKDDYTTSNQGAVSVRVQSKSIQVEFKPEKQPKTKKSKCKIKSAPSDSLDTQKHTAADKGNNLMKADKEKCEEKVSLTKPIIEKHSVCKKSKYQDMTSLTSPKKKSKQSAAAKVQVPVKKLSSKSSQRELKNPSSNESRHDSVHKKNKSQSYKYKVAESFKFTDSVSSPKDLGRKHVVSKNLKSTATERSQTAEQGLTQGNPKKHTRRRSSVLSDTLSVKEGDEIEKTARKLPPEYCASHDNAPGLQSYKIPKKDASRGCARDLSIISPLTETAAACNDGRDQTACNLNVAESRNLQFDFKVHTGIDTNLNERSYFGSSKLCELNIQCEGRVSCFSAPSTNSGGKKTDSGVETTSNVLSAHSCGTVGMKEISASVPSGYDKAEFPSDISLETSGNLCLNLSEEKAKLPCKALENKTVRRIPCVDGVSTEESSTSSSSSDSQSDTYVSTRSVMKRKLSENRNQESCKNIRMVGNVSPAFSEKVEANVSPPFGMPKSVKHWFDEQYQPWTFWSPISSPNAHHHSAIFSPPRPASPDKLHDLNLSGLVPVGHGCMDVAGSSSKHMIEHTSGSQDLFVPSQSMEIPSNSLALKENQNERNTQRSSLEVMEINTGVVSKEKFISKIGWEENSDEENNPSTHVISIPLSTSPSRAEFISEKTVCSSEAESKATFTSSRNKCCYEGLTEGDTTRSTFSMSHDIDDKSADYMSNVHEANLRGVVGSSESSDFQCGQTLGRRNTGGRLLLLPTFLKPLKKPPSRVEVAASLELLNIPCVVNSEPFYSDHIDVKGRIEVGGNVLDLKSKKCIHLEEFHSSIPGLMGLNRQQRRLFQHVWGLSQIKEDFNDLVRNQFDEREAMLAPVKRPPKVRDVVLWTRARQIINQKKSATMKNSHDDERKRISVDLKQDVGSCSSANITCASPIIKTTRTENVVHASTPTVKSKDIENSNTQSPLLTPIFPTQVQRHSKIEKRMLTRSKRYLQKLSPCGPSLAAVSEVDEDSLGIEPLEAEDGSVSSDVKVQNSFEDSSLCKLLLDTQFCENAASPMIRNSDASACQIKGPNASPGFKMVFENLQSAKTVKEYQYTTLLVVEVHICTCGSLKPDPERDPVRAIFFSVVNDVPEDDKIPFSVNGIIAVQSSNSTTPILNRCGVEGIIKYAADENALFQELICLMRQWNPDILAGFEIEMLSWGYLLQRACVLGLNLIQELSRVPNLKETKQEDSLEDKNGLSGLKITGRIVLDVWRLFRSEVALQSYSFENLMFHILHQRVSLHSFKSLSSWWENPSHLHRWMTVRHYQQRVHGIIKLLDQLDIIGRTSELARLFGIQFFEVLSRGSQFRVESMMLRLAKPMNFIPVSPSVQQRAHMRAPECLPLIMEPESRFYTDPLIVLDFQSLYPSMIIAYNYCFSTCLGRIEHLGKSTHFEFGCSELRISKSRLQQLKDNVSVSPCGIAFVTKEVRPGILPRMLEEILEARLAVKQTMKQNKGDHTLQRVLHARQLGLKLIANVTYGYTSANFSGRMPCIEVGDSVVSKGRETLERAITLVHNNAEWQARVVYGDTDSLFVLVPGRSRKEAFRIGAEIAEAVTQDNPSPVKLKLEKVYQPSILQTKKRYVGFMYESPEQNEPVYEAKGIETVRRDGCPAVAKMLEKSLKLLFETCDVSSVKSYVKRQFTKILAGRASIQDLIFAREYRGKENYRPGACVPALELTKRWLRHDRRAEPRIGERVPYVVINGHPGSALIHLVRHPSELLGDSSLKYNAVYYITRVIIPPLARCFSLLGSDVPSWYAELPRRSQISLPAVIHSGMKKTISQYFTTMECVCCGSLTHHGACAKCRSYPQLLVTSLMNKLHLLESTHLSIMKICQSCLGRAQPLECESLDCPITFRRHQASLKYEHSSVFTHLLKEFCMVSESS